MNSNEFKSAWDRHKADFKQQHPGLTDEDLVLKIGQEGKMLERLEGKVGKTKEQIQDWLHLMG